jgi:hypothetical protein
LGTKMKKMKKFAAGGRFVDEGESQRYVEDTPDPVAEVPVAAAIPAAIGLRGGSPMTGGLGPIRGGGGPMGAGLAPVLSDTAGGFTDGQDFIMPVGQIRPPHNRGIGGMAAAMKKGGAVNKKAKGGSTSSASKRADGCATKGKTKGRFV